MAGKNKNKALLIIFVALIGIFLVGKFFRESKRESSFNKDVVQIDTAEVTGIMLYPQSENGELVHITRTGNSWRVKSGNINSPVEPGSVQNLLGEAIRINPKQLVAKEKGKWTDYHVNDSLGTRLQIREGGKSVLDIYIGKFSYKQVQNPYGGSRGNIIGTSYFRIAGKDEVYATDGFLTMTFNQGFNSWRDQRFIRLTKDNVTRISFKYFADSSFVVEKAENSWKIGDVAVDSLKMDNYLQKISAIRKSVFKDGFKPPLKSSCQMTIEGNNMESIVVQAYETPDGEWILHSTINPESYFTDEDKNFVKDVLIRKENLLFDSEKQDL